MSGDVPAGSQLEPDALGNQLSDAERAAAFAPRESSDRVAALRAGRTPVPPKFIVGVVMAFVVLGLGGAVAEHYVGSYGAATTAFASPTTNPHSRVASNQILSLEPLKGAPASPLALTDQFGRRWSLALARGKVVVLTFLNRNCNDVCPVLDAELRESRSILGASATKVDYVIVNTDPLHVGAVASPIALARTGMAGDGSTFFLTGSLQRLNAVWSRYGVGIRVLNRTKTVVHNNIMYFIDPQGRLRYQATPFGNESRTGSYSLGTFDLRRFGQAVAATISSLSR